MPATEIIDLEGHIIDSLLLTKVMDVILASGAEYRLLDVEIGRTNTDASSARLEVTAPDETQLRTLLEELRAHGAKPVRRTTDDATELSWGRRFLMCPPEHFALLYEINSWMSTEVAVDPDRARAQWDHLVATLGAAGATVELMDPVEGLPDLVFTANAGIVNGRQFVPARFRHAERQGETPYDIAWFSDAGFEVTDLPAGVAHEGAGDALPFGDVLLSGYRTRSDVGAHADLSKLTGAPVRSVELVDDRLYHLDITFCPLDDRRAMIAPDAWDRYGARVVDELVPEPLVLERDDAYGFVANSVVVGRTIVMPACPPRVGRQLEAWGLDVVVVDVSEFQKAGGACRCLTLALDVDLS